MQDPDDPVGELAQDGVEFDAAGSLLLVVGPGAGEIRSAEKASHRLGRHRWVVERTVSWLAGCRRLHRRYERKAERFLAFGGIAAALICHRRLINGAASRA